LPTDGFAGWSFHHNHNIGPRALAGDPEPALAPVAA
jgi:hypothetical protein